MAILPPQNPDRVKSLTFAIAGLFLVLVLIEKSLGYTGGNLPKNWSREGFRNLGNSNHLGHKKNTFPERTSDPLATNEFEDDLNWEEDVLDDPVSIDETKRIARVSPDDRFAIPEVNLPEDNFPIKGKAMQEPPGYISIYFLKFYGQGNNSQSHLVKVTRPFPGGDPIQFISSELTSGPSAEEKSKGVLNSLPRKLKYEKRYRLENGILHLSFSRDLELGGSPEILKDRLDQLCYSFIGIYGIKGVVLYVGNTRLRSLGGDGISLPDLLVKSPRKVILF